MTFLEKDFTKKRQVFHKIFLRSDCKFGYFLSGIFFVHGTLNFKLLFNLNLYYYEHFSKSFEQWGFD